MSGPTKDGEGPQASIAGGRHARSPATVAIEKEVCKSPAARAFRLRLLSFFGLPSPESLGWSCACPEAGLTNPALAIAGTLRGASGPRVAA